MAKKKDKYQAMEEMLEKYEYTNEDLSKLLCQSYGRDMKEHGVLENKFSKTYYGQGSKFIMTIKMMPL